MEQLFQVLGEQFIQRLDNIERKVSEMEQKLTEMLEIQERTNRTYLNSMRTCQTAFSQIKQVVEALNENIDEASGTLTLDTWNDGPASC